MAAYSQPALKRQSGFLENESTTNWPKKVKFDPEHAIDDADCLSKASAAEAGELCEILLQYAGHTFVNAQDDPRKVAHLLAKEYSPRVAELLVQIALRLGKANEGGLVARHSAVSLPVHTVEDVRVVPGSEGEVSDVESGMSSMDEQLIPDSLSMAKCRSSSSTVTVAMEEPTENDVSHKVKTIVGNRDVLPDTSGEYKKDTEIALSRIFSLGKVAAVQNPAIAPFDPHDGPAVVCMSGFGELGRFGNQVLQYAFLRCYAEKHGISEVQVPAWVGAGLFGFNDRPVQRAFPAVVETREAKANSTFTTEFMNYIKASNAGRPVPEVDASHLTGDPVATSCGTSVDFWGWFQWHTSGYAPHKALLQNLFTPVAALEQQLSHQFNKHLRYKDNVKRTVVGLHLRLGDYQNISASSFGYCAPTSWYLELLEKIWPQLENPVLFVASDDIEAVLRDFAPYQPITADMAGITVPDSMQHLKAGFFPDWWCLTQCDVLAISNSTFSFTACMMNRRPNAQFYRAHYSQRMIPFEPWNSDPIIHRHMSRTSVLNAMETLQVVYNTQGARGVVRNVLYELPYYGIRSAIMKTVLWRSARDRVQQDANLLKSSQTAIPAP